MKSMTGYGYVEYRGDTFQVSLDLKSYNSRYLEMMINVPTYIGAVEPRIREFLAARIARGRVELYLRIVELEEAIEATIDHRAVETYVRVLRELAGTAGVEPTVTIDHLLGLDGVLKTSRRPDVDAYWSTIEPQLEKLFEQFEKARVREGETTERDIQEKVGIIEASIGRIEANIAGLQESVRKTLRERFVELLGENVDESRVMAETALLLAKSDIGEEIVRMRSHLSSFADSVAGGGPIGKRLDFICQEIGREINTIGSKSTLIEVNQAVIEVKDALEKIREQLRNVE
jgi:uncharacterized protein (TIGR00255 family)